MGCVEYAELLESLIEVVGSELLRISHVRLSFAFYLDAIQR